MTRGALSLVSVAQIHRNRFVRAADYCPAATTAGYRQLPAVIGRVLQCHPRGGGRLVPEQRWRREKLVKSTCEHDD